MKSDYSVALFQNVSSVLKAEKKLKATDVKFKIIPVPKSISSDCGLCIRFLIQNNDKIRMLLNDIENIEYRDLN